MIDTFTLSSHMARTNWLSYREFVARVLAHVVVRRDVVCAVSARASRHRRLPRPGHAAALEATTVHCLRTRN